MKMIFKVKVLNHKIMSNKIWILQINKILDYKV